MALFAFITVRWTSILTPLDWLQKNHAALCLWLDRQLIWLTPIAKGVSEDAVEASREMYVLLLLLLPLLRLCLPFLLPLSFRPFSSLLSSAVPFLLRLICCCRKKRQTGKKPPRTVPQQAALLIKLATTLRGRLQDPSSLAELLVMHSLLRGVPEMLLLSQSQDVEQVIEGANQLTGWIEAMAPWKHPADVLPHIVSLGSAIPREFFEAGDHLVSPAVTEVAGRLVKAVKLGLAKHNKHIEECRPLLQAIAAILPSALGPDMPAQPPLALMKCMPVEDMTELDLSRLWKAMKLSSKRLQVLQEEKAGNPSEAWRALRDALPSCKVWSILTRLLTVGRPSATSPCDCSLFVPASLMWSARSPHCAALTRRRATDRASKPSETSSS